MSSGTRRREAGATGRVTIGSVRSTRHGLAGLSEFFGDRSLDGVVLSTHGDITWELVEDLVQRHVVRAGEGGFEKGSTWVVEVDDGVPVKARYLPAP